MEIVQYAKSLETIGDLIIAISQRIGTNTSNAGMDNAIKHYYDTLSLLENAKRPSKIESEHSVLVENLRNWIKVTESYKDIKNQDDLNSFLKRQKEAEEKIDQTLNALGDKLSK